MAWPVSWENALSSINCCHLLECQDVTLLAKWSQGISNYASRLREKGGRLPGLFCLSRTLSSAIGVVERQKLWGASDLLSKHCISLRCFSPVESQHGLPTHVPLFFFLFPKELASALKSALSGHLETVILGLMKTPAQYDASELKASMKVNTVSIRSASNIGELQSSECN